MYSVDCDVIYIIFSNSLIFSSRNDYSFIRRNSFSIYWSEVSYDWSYIYHQINWIKLFQIHLPFYVLFLHFLSSVLWENKFNFSKLSTIFSSHNLLTFGENLYKFNCLFRFSTLIVFIIFMDLRSVTIAFPSLDTVKRSPDLSS